MSKLSLIVLAVLIMAGPVVAGDLYKVDVTSENDAEQLDGVGVEPIARLSGAYIVLADGDAAVRLERLSLKRTLLAAGVNKDELALDNRLDDGNLGRFQLLYQEGGFRLYRIDAALWPRLDDMSGLSRVHNENLRIVYRVGKLFGDFAKTARALDIDLDSLIGLVVQDSLYSYDSTLQAFNGRVAGTASNRAARDWIRNKFVSFGYDSVMLDTFAASVGGTNECYNVVATKTGAIFPNHHVVVGAHHDAVSSSPGADDNGSGTCGVLELARILADIETDMTFIFVTFDAEEFGLYGSWHYADEAYARGDTIVYMFNMDMIGSVGNDAEVTVYHGAETNYSMLYNWLADSLLGLTGYLSGNIAASDHYPFTQYDWTSTFIIEYNFSPVYHTYQDSTTWMDFGYMTKLVKSALATTYYVNATEGPFPAVQFSYPAGVPQILPPEQTSVLQVAVSGAYGGTPVSGSGMLYCNVDGHGWVPSAMTEVAADLYEATLPAAPCDSRVSFYVGAEEAVMGMQYDPDPSAPYEAVVATTMVAAMEDDFETDQGWTNEVLGATSGQWQRGVPVNDASWEYDPISDGDGSGRCYLTQNTYGNTDVDDGAVRLTSPVFDMSNGGYLEYDYFLKLTNTAGGVDMLLVEVSSDGGASNWTEVARYVTDGGLDWYHEKISSEDLTGLGVSLTSNIKVRFTANDADPQSIVEAGIDGFNVIYYECVDPWVCGDVDGDGEGPNIADLVYLVDYMFNSGPPPLHIPSVDYDFDTEITVSDLIYLVDYMFNSGPEPVCQ